MAASGTPVTADNQRWKERPAQGKWLLTGFWSPGYFLLTVAEEEELESWRNIVSDIAAFWLVNVKGGDGGAHEVVIVGSHLGVNVKCSGIQRNVLCVQSKQGS